MSKKKTCRWFEVCPLKRFYQQGKIDKRWIEDYCLADNPECLRRILEEKGVYHADNLMPDGTINRSLR